ncbi:SRPBCC family protein [Amycolatopsis sp. FDAARGOS 1241]|uniref:SRPBCC family protein n=1 Tax=Amycolatopsis sp. FDAARGOS 1241 TaxID=2778070 RepID=UPI001950BB9E|nr:SRPBCC family protein [Amycolatopsis sp. FDAARGOS 1241]QRP50843.1 SRPBCC family protein [Amycolatopsis sp. FDAARGOS 1241]
MTGSPFGRRLVRPSPARGRAEKGLWSSKRRRPRRRTTRSPTVRRPRGDDPRGGDTGLRTFAAPAVVPALVPGDRAPAGALAVVLTVLPPLCAPHGWVRSIRGGSIGGVTDSVLPTVVTADRVIAAAAPRIFELIADPAHQPRWDGNDNLAEAQDPRRVRGTGEVFTMLLTSGGVRANHIVEFEEARRIAWLPSEPDNEPPGHLWRWDLVPLDDGRTRVTHAYDWTNLTDEKRLVRARATTPDKLRASLDRLAELAEAD